MYSKEDIRNTLTGQVIADSKHSFVAVKLFAQGKTAMAVMRDLHELGFNVTYESVRDFRYYFFEPLYALLRLEMEKDAEDRSKHRDIPYVNMSRKDVVIDIIKSCARQIQQLEEPKSLTAYERTVLQTYYDKIFQYRKILEEINLKSEVEQAREKGIELVVQVALEHLKHDPAKAREFIDQVSQKAGKTS
jgi:hypothetical protein